MFINYVDDNSIVLAETMEKALIESYKDTGIHFASVRAQPSENGVSSQFLVYVGTDKDRDMFVTKSWAEKVLNAFIKENQRVTVSVLIGKSLFTYVSE